MRAATYSPNRPTQFYDRRGIKNHSLFAQFINLTKTGRRMNDPSFFNEYKEVFYGLIGALITALGLRRKYSKDTLEISEDKAQMNVLEMMQDENERLLKRLEIFQAKIDELYAEKNHDNFLKVENNSLKFELMQLKQQLEDEKMKTVNVIVKPKKEFDATKTDNGT